MNKWFINCLKGLPLGLAVLFLFSCDKHDIPPDFSKAKFTIAIKSGGNTVIWDSVHCTNAAGNKYSVETVNFYISDIEFKRSDGTVFAPKKVFYIDAANTAKSAFQIDSIPPATYTEFSFIIGLNNQANVTNGLPSTLDNLIMAWPTSMGGGYHFLKLEGHYLDTINVKKGYAIHLGRNGNQVKVKLNQTLLQKFWNHTYTLVYDVNEVFANPYTYNLNYDMNYTMADSASMVTIKNNMSDAFSLIQNN